MILLPYITDIHPILGLNVKNPYIVSLFSQNDTPTTRKEPPYNTETNFFPNLTCKEPGKISKFPPQIQYFILQAISYNLRKLKNSKLQLTFTNL